MIGKLCEKIKWLFWTPVNRMYFSLKGVEYGRGFRSNGRIYIKCAGGKLRLGSNVKINSGITYNPIGVGWRTTFQLWDGELFIEDNVGLSNVSITCSKNVRIRSNAKIGDGVKIFDTDFHSINPYYRNSAEDTAYARKRAVDIGQGTFVGAGSYILKGTEIGEHSVIGAASVVSGKVPANQIWAGNRAVFLRYLTEQELKKAPEFDIRKG